MRLIDWLNVHTVDLDKPVPVHAKTEKIPYVAQWSQHLWVLVHAFIPIVVQQLWLSVSGRLTIGAWGIFLIYFNMYNIVAIREVHLLRHLGHKYGFLDGDAHARDGVPDTGAGKVVSSLFKVTGARIALAIYFTYDSDITPLDAVSNWQWWAWLTLEIGLYCLVLDFWFYWYHRAMHDVDFLWDFHRTHHTTKHPNPLLTAYADHEQEFFDIVIIPLLTFASLRAMGLPFGFYEFWVCQQYVVFTELWGHSGIRLHLTPPNTFSWFLQKLDAEIVIEDHDLHHRKGWRKYACHNNSPITCHS